MLTVTLAAAGETHFVHLSAMKEVLEQSPDEIVVDLGVSEPKPHTAQQPGFGDELALATDDHLYLDAQCGQDSEHFAANFRKVVLRVETQAGLTLVGGHRRYALEVRVREQRLAKRVERGLGSVGIGYVRHPDHEGARNPRHADDLNAAGVEERGIARFVNKVVLLSLGHSHGESPFSQRSCPLPKMGGG
jgi:hypothetical protein